MLRTLQSLAFLPLLLAPAAFLGGCGGQADDAAPLAVQPAAPAAAPAGRPVIAGLRMRDHLLTVVAGEEGLRFDLIATGGEPIETDMSLEELQDRHPLISEHYSSAVALPVSGIPYVGH